MRTVIIGIGDDRPVDDIFMGDVAYRALFGEAGLQVVTEARPMATCEEPYARVSETTVAPWVLIRPASRALSRPPLALACTRR